jgi:alpha-N-arabinofuranosidase
MNKLQSLIAGMSVSVLIPLALSAQTLVVKPNAPIAPIQPTMYGAFFEDINFGADGGLYAELIKNRSFEFYKPLMGWKEVKTNENDGAVLIQNRKDTKPSNPRYATITLNSGAPIGLINEGFRGMGVKQGNQYNFSILARVKEGASTKITVELLNNKGESIGKTSFDAQGSDWKKYTASLTSSQTDNKGAFKITFENKGVIDVDMISLFPQDTWKNRPGGLRADLVQLLADMKPGFLRFPGGCIVEGHDLSLRYQWKKTIGPVEEREMIVNRWNSEFSHRPTPDYYQSFGLGFFEYFQLCEDIGAQALPILNCGMACEFNTSEVVPMDQLDPYVQDALDLIEFANGSADSKWGKIRAQMGHAAPFNLKFIGVGNEQWGPQYFERYIVFEKAIRAKYPDIIIVTGSGPSPNGKDFDYAWKELRKLNAQIIDEHYYSSPEWFLKNATRYDGYDRQGPKVFAGEYAAQSVAVVSPDNKNTWWCALSEAAFMTGLERNAAVVQFSSYAPLFAHVDAWQWTPDMIWFDNLRSVGSANYYVQKLYSLNKGTQVVPLLLDNKAVTGQDGLYATAALDETTNEIILKLVNSTESAKTPEIVLEGVSKVSSSAKMTVLTAGSKDAMNTLNEPTKISPVESQIKAGKKMKLTLQPLSLTVVRIKK